MRYPRDNCAASDTVNTLESIPIGQSESLREGRGIAILMFGPFTELALQLAEQFDCSLINMRFVKPLDEQRLRQLSENHHHFFCIEDNCMAGGAGSAVNEFVSAQTLDVKCSLHGLQDQFPAQGTRSQVLSQNGLAQQQLAKKLEEILAESGNS